MKREDKIREILLHGKKIGANQLSVLSVLAFTTDKGMTKFHKDFLELKKDKV